MSRSTKNRMVAETVQVVGAALGGAVVGLVATAIALGSFWFGILGGAAGGVAAAITTLSRFELAEA